MAPKKNKKSNKLARMSDEEKLRYLQHRAAIEEETKRRKEQLVATYLKVFKQGVQLTCFINDHFFKLYVIEQVEKRRSVYKVKYCQTEPAMATQLATNQVQGAQRRNDGMYRYYFQQSIANCMLSLIVTIKHQI